MNDLFPREKGLFFFDGSTGAVLQSQGLPVGEDPGTWSLTKPDLVTALHAAYFRAGCRMVNTNTFLAADRHLDETTLRRRIEASVRLARRAADRAFDSPSFLLSDPPSRPLISSSLADSAAA